MKKGTTARPARPSGRFTLVELLVVIGVIGLLASMLFPALQHARNRARAVRCRANLHECAVAMTAYLGDNNHAFWPYVQYNTPETGVKCYFWGTATRPVDPSASPLMPYLSNMLDTLWCPELPWNSYVPQGSVNEPTTCFGYNAYYLHPNFFDPAKPTRRVTEIPDPAQLFVLNDAAMSWAPAGVPILQNSTYLEPVNGNWVQMPTTHFRHPGNATHALCADGHTGVYKAAAGDIMRADQMLGFVGDRNEPHYAQ